MDPWVQILCGFHILNDTNTKKQEMMMNVGRMKEAKCRHRYLGVSYLDRQVQRMRSK